ncbi:hypothetical protein PG984_012102 [Apiospora sp. TS-2023a]
MVRRSRPNKNRARGIANTRRGIFKKANTGHKYYGYEVAAVIRANGRVSTYESRPGILLDQTTWNVHYNCGPDDFKIEGWTDNPHKATDSATDQSSSERSTTSISDMPGSLDDLLALDFTSTPSVHSSVTAKSTPLSTSPVLAGQSFAPETPMPFLLGEPESNPPRADQGLQKTTYTLLALYLEILNRIKDLLRPFMGLKVPRKRVPGRQFSYQA